MSLSQTAHADRITTDLPLARIALLGCGTVGSGVAQLLLDDASSLRARSGLGIAFAGIAVRSLQRLRAGSIPRDLLTDDAIALVDDPGVDLVIECIGGVGIARDLVERALLSGKHVVTANKDLLATHGPRLRALALEGGVLLAYEAAVGGAIPIVRTIATALAGETILEVGGVLNGTTNFILGRMGAGDSYGEALAEAQRLGFAEADPHADVAGIDAAHKLAILAQLAFGRAVTTPDIARAGIESVSREDLSLAKRLGLNVKLLAVARANEAIVTPAYVPCEHAFAEPRGAGNCIRVVGRSAGSLTFSGLGAGGPPTASAVIADVVAALRRMAAGRTTDTLDAPLRDAGRLRPLVLRSLVRLGSLADIRPAYAALAAAGVASDTFAGIPALATVDPRAADGARVTALLADAALRPASVLPLWNDLP
ncbi:MAG: homoserine dehydrogenase [Candidatus Baltobacteraceae bacterium]